MRNSSFLSKDIEAQKAKSATKASPPKTSVLVAAPPRKSSLIKENSKDGSVSSPSIKTPSPPDVIVASPPKKEVINKLNHIPPFRNDIKQTQKNEVTSPSVSKVMSPPLKKVFSPPSSRDSPTQSKGEVLSPPFNKGVTSPPINTFKFNRADSKSDENILASKKKEIVLAKEAPIKLEKLSLTTTNDISDKIAENDTSSSNKIEETENGDKTAKAGESNGVGDKIRKFEKAAEDANVNAGRLLRPGSVRGRSRSERIGSDSKDDLPPPATPFKDHVFFDIGNTDKPTEPPVQNTETQERLVTKGLVSSTAMKWQRNEEEKIQKPEPQKIIKPEFKPMPSPIDVTIRSPSLGTKLPDQFPSHGTAFRNVASPDTARPKADDVNTQNSFKCKLKNKEKYSVSKGSSYFTRGSEEIWLVKKKDIEEIEERVLDSFRRAGGNMCMRSESMRPSSDSGQSTAFTHATMGRTKRQMYGRSESLDPQWAGARAQTLKRQSSVACTCGHDKKTRAKSVDTAPRTVTTTTKLTSSISMKRWYS